MLRRVCWRLNRSSCQLSTLAGIPASLKPSTWQFSLLSSVRSPVTLFPCLSSTIVYFRSNAQCPFSTCSGGVSATSVPLAQYRARRRLFQLVSPTLLVLPQPLGRALPLSRGTDHASPAFFNVPSQFALAPTVRRFVKPARNLPLPHTSLYLYLTIPYRTRPRRDFSIAISLCRVTTHLHFLIRHFHEC